MHHPFPHPPFPPVIFAHTLAFKMVTRAPNEFIQLRLSISHSLNEAIGEKDEEDADVDVASLTRLQVPRIY
jgi:hypothetical protein